MATVEIVLRWVGPGVTGQGYGWEARSGSHSAGGNTPEDAIGTLLMAAGDRIGIRIVLAQE